MMRRPGQLCCTIFELHGILADCSPIKNIAPPCDSKIAVSHIGISIKFRLTVRPQLSEVIQICHTSLYQQQ